MPSVKKVAVKTTAAKKTGMGGPKPKFTVIGRGKLVHVIHTKAYDLKHSGCQQVRKATVAEKFDYKAKGLSPEAALALDGCTDCGTEVVAKEVLKATETPESRRNKADDVRNEVLDRAANKKQKPAAKVAKASKPKAEPKEAKPKKASMTKAGPRSTARASDGDGAQIKAMALVDFAKENGWSATLDKDGDHWMVTATRNNETIHAWYIDGKYDINRHAEIVVGSWTGKLRGAHAARRQMAMEGRDRPHPEPGKGRTGPRGKSESKTEDEVPEDESPEDASKRVPFSVDDDAIVIIDAIKGKVIKWRNGSTKVIEEGWVPTKSKGTKIIDHPKTGRRILSFYNVDSVGEHGEVLGVERNVYIDKIVRVVG